MLFHCVCLICVIFANKISCIQSRIFISINQSELTTRFVVCFSQSSLMTTKIMCVRLDNMDVCVCVWMENNGDVRGD